MSEEYIDIDNLSIHLQIQVTSQINTSIHSSLSSQKHCPKRSDTYLYHFEPSSPGISCLKDGRASKCWIGLITNSHVYREVVLRKTRKIATAVASSQLHRPLVAQDG